MVQISLSFKGGNPERIAASADESAGQHGPTPMKTVESEAMLAKLQRRL